MAVLSKCVVGSSLVQLALGDNDPEVVNVSKMSEIVWDVSKDKDTFLQDILQKNSDSAYELKVAFDATVCGKLREFKDGEFTSGVVDNKGKKTVYKINFKTFSFEESSTKTLANLWNDCMQSIAKAQWNIDDSNASKLLDDKETSIKFVDTVFQKNKSKGEFATQFESVFGKSFENWAVERVSKTNTREQYQTIEDSTETDLWTDKVKTKIFRKIVLSMMPAAPAQSAITEQQQSDIATQIAEKIKIDEDVARKIAEKIGGVEIDIMKSKGLLALLVSGLFMTACNFAWNFYQWKLKESSDVDNEEDDSTDPESDE